MAPINKFDVFYSWAGFFLRVKVRGIKEWGRRYSDSFSADMRVFYNMDSGLNIVPADYAAKVMYQICMQSAEGESYHLVNDYETPHRIYIPIMLKTINFDGVVQVNAVPENMNKIEQLYYKTVGSVFTPYIVSGPMLFNTQNIKKVMMKAGVACPRVNSDNFSILINYAKGLDFGLTEKRSLRLSAASNIG